MISRLSPYHEQVERALLRRGALPWAGVAATAAAAAVVGYGVRADLGYVSSPPIVGEFEFYGAFALVAVVALLAAAAAARPRERGASRWGWGAGVATAASAIGYGIQTILDHVDEPRLVGELEFYGLFVGCALGALALGAGAVLVGRRRADLTARLGFLALAYVLLVQLIQSLWD